MKEAAPDRSFDSLKRLMHLLAPYKGRVLALSLLISGSAALGTVAPQFVRVAFDTVIPSADPVLFGWLAAAYAGFYLLRAVISYAAMYLSFAFTQGIISDIRMRAYSRLLRLPVARFTTERSGSLVSRVVSDVNALEGMIQAGSTRLAGQLFSIVVVLAIVVAMNWKLALVNLVVTPLLAYVARKYQGPLRQASRRIRARVGEMTAVASEAIGNIQVVKTFAAEKGETDRFRQENDAYVQFNLDRRKDVGMMESLITLTATYGVGAILLYGGWLVVQGSLTVGELTAFLMYQRMLQRPVMSVMFFNNQLQSGMAALERVSDLMDSPVELEGTLAALPEGEVVFDRVTFTYPGSEQPVLRDLGFVLGRTETVALVGPSGAGKSTITRLLTRLFDPDSGAIRIAGQDIRDLELETLRNAIAIVPQEPTLFSGSVRDNIRYARPEASDREIRWAAEVANADGFIAALPQQYETEIGERGTKLSGGQKQRIAIARAVLKNARVLVLDEATASLDSESEAIIQDALEGIFAGDGDLATIIIAHRLSTVQNADRIVVLDEGRLVESGTHAELLAGAGLYARLYELQHGGETLAG